MGGWGGSCTEPFRFVPLASPSPSNWGGCWGILTFFTLEGYLLNMLGPTETEFFLAGRFPQERSKKTQILPGLLRGYLEGHIKSSLNHALTKLLYRPRLAIERIGNLIVRLCWAICQMPPGSIPEMFGQSVPGGWHGSWDNEGSCWGEGSAVSFLADGAIQRMGPFKEWASESPSTQEEPALCEIVRFVFVKAERLLSGMQAFGFSVAGSFLNLLTVLHWGSIMVAMDRKPSLSASLAIGEISTEVLQ